MFLLVNEETGQIVRVVRNGCWTNASFETESAAKAGATRMVKSGKINSEECIIVDALKYRELYPVKMVERVNLMSGKTYMEAEDTPGYCSPSSEAYWSM